jgi:hypothetical protein
MCLLLCVVFGAIAAFAGMRRTGRTNALYLALPSGTKFGIALFVKFLAALTPLVVAPALLADESVPDCRLDDEIASAVRIATRWGIDDLKRSGLDIPFDDVAVNPRGAVPRRTLPVEIIKDAAASTVDGRGCIKPVEFRVGTAVIATDGPCLATRLESCNSADRKYIQRRFFEIHGALKDWETGYEMGGACYMTNLHACLYEHRLPLLNLLGARDSLSIKGTCVTNAVEPAGIRCSAGALKMLLSSEAIAERATTIGMVLVLGHELGHLAAGQTSSYGAGENVIDLSWTPRDKLAHIENQCRAGESLRKREHDADELALRIARHRLPEIARKWPKQGTTAWLVTQAVHQATNLMRWNADWRERGDVQTPREFDWNPSGRAVVLKERDIKDIMSGAMVSGRSPREIESAAREFLCRMTQTGAGEWDVLMQSGSTHGTMTERLGQIIGSLRSVSPGPNSRVELETMLGGISDLLLVRHRAYLRELEGAICTLIEGPVDCSSVAIEVAEAEKPVPAGPGGPRPRKLPVVFFPKGQYREVTGSPRVLIMGLSPCDFRATQELALQRGRQIVATYTALLSEIDNILRSQGGYWVNESHSDLGIAYNAFTSNFSASLQLNAIARVSGDFAIEMIPAWRELRSLGHGGNIRIYPWNESRHEVVIHFFRNATPGAIEDSQRVITNALPFDQIFDLEAAQAGAPNQPAPFFRDLLPFLHERLKASFGGLYTLGYDHAPGAFYITAAGLGENFHLPDEWQSLIYSSHVRSVTNAVLGAAVNRVYIDNRKEQDVAKIFRSSK